MGHPSQRHGDAEQVAVLFCDIDHFKDINDNHGHSGGDAVLQALGQRLRSSTRLGDLVGRLGGDELLVVLQGVPSLDVALTIANKLHTAARDPLRLPTGTVMLTLSIGVTLIKPDEAIEAVVARADQAMYAAKQAGRDRVVAFS
jgi:diguanylate cyclase (GGDEF)-like protein